MKKLTIQRLGGMLPALRPTVCHPLETLDEAQQQALAQWLAQAGRARGAAHAEAMNYVFTLHDDTPGAAEAPLKVSAPYADVPAALKGLLPAAGAVRAGSKASDEGPGKGPGQGPGDGPAKRSGRKKPALPGKGYGKGATKN